MNARQRDVMNSQIWGK